ncbi:MAG: hypothetical protein JSS81_17975 [Acidobacteria bacterium]|nr:hypothetical protein [Acidobacteriota bacterium]
MNENVTIVFHGFLNLTAKEKLRLVESINEYFDATDREPVRAAADAEFAALDPPAETRKCPCCGR